MRLLLLCALLVAFSPTDCQKFITASHPLPYKFNVSTWGKVKDVECSVGTAVLRAQLIVNVEVPASECSRALDRVFGTADGLGTTVGNQLGAAVSDTFERTIALSARDVGNCVAVRIHSVRIEYEMGKFVWIFECTDTVQPNAIAKAWTWEWFIWVLLVLCFLLPLVVISSNCAIDTHITHRILRSLRAWKSDVLVDLKKKVMTPAGSDEEDAMTPKSIVDSWRETKVKEIRETPLTPEHGINKEDQQKVDKKEPPALPTQPAALSSAPTHLPTASKHKTGAAPKHIIESTRSSATSTTSSPPSEKNAQDALDESSEGKKEHEQRANRVAFLQKLPQSKIPRPTLRHT